MSVTALSPQAGRANGAATVDHNHIRQLAHALAEDLRQTATERERRNELPTTFLQRLRDNELVNLMIPQRFGGLGGTVPLMIEVLTEISRGDGAVGALLGYHYTNSGLPRLLDVVGDAEAIERRSAENRWLWGNVSQPFERNFKADPKGDGFVINGTKAWNTGPSLADVTSVLAPRTDRREILYAVIPARREGLRYHQDWDHLGLRLTDTVSITFEDVEVRAEEVLHSSHPDPILSFPPLYGAIGELIFASYYLGSVQGAIEAAREYTRTRTKPPIPSGLDSATKDPYILRDYGDFWTKVQAARAYLLQVAGEVQAGFEKRRTISAAERGVLTVKANSARAFVTQVALDVTPRVYDVTGASATANRHGFDRYWRDVRTHTLHDSHAYKVRAVGDYFVNGVANEIPAFI